MSKWMIYLVFFLILWKAFKSISCLLEHKEHICHAILDNFHLGIMQVQQQNPSEANIVVQSVKKHGEDSFLISEKEALVKRMIQKKVIQKDLIPKKWKPHLKIAIQLHSVNSVASSKKPVWLSIMNCKECVHWYASLYTQHIQTLFLDRVVIGNEEWILHHNVKQKHQWVSCGWNKKEWACIQGRFFWVYSWVCKVLFIMSS